MQDLTPFNYQDQQVRVVRLEGEPWFVLADLCKILGLGNRAMVANRLDEDMKGVSQIDTPGGQQSVTVVSEPGMYEVVIRSDKPEATAFRRWITTDVLPQIRKTGSYSRFDDQIPKTLPEALVAYAQEIKAKEAAIAYAAELEPKADAYQAFLNSDGTYAIGAVAKFLGRSQNKLFDELRNHQVLISKGSMRNTPYQRYMHHFRVSAYTYPRSDGTTGTSYTTTVQPSGVEFIRRKLQLPAPLFDAIEAGAL